MAQGSGARPAAREELWAQLQGARRRGDWAAAEAVVRSALEAAPGDLFWRAQLAQVLVHRGQAAEAVQLADALLQQRPGYVPALVARGTAALELGKAEEARQALEAAWAEAPTPFVATQLARARARLEAASAVLDFLRQARERFPADPWLRKEEARLLQESGQLDRAAEAYQEALQAEPEDSYALARRLELQLRDRPPTEAAREVERILRLPARAASPHLHALRARLLEKAGQWAEAAAAWQVALQRGPQDPYLLASLAYALRRAGDKTAALALLQEYLQGKPWDVRALNTLVSDARELGRQEEVAGFLRELVRQHPQQRNLWGFLRRLQAKGDAGSRSQGLR